MFMKKIITLIVALVIPQLAGAIGAIFTTPKIGTWYATLVRPELNPPNYIFGPVWTTLFLLMGIALFIVIKDGIKTKEIKTAVWIFAGQLILNIFWSIIFFNLENPLASFIELIALWVLILLNIIYFAKINKVAAYLLIPYILWVSFAGYLNFMIWFLN
jgi:tryptophan-rich sensory protein